MKRSTILNKITDIISEVCYREIAEIRAARVLDAIEEMGMLPPSIQIEVGDFFLEDSHEWSPEE